MSGMSVKAWVAGQHPVRISHRASVADAAAVMAASGVRALLVDAPNGPGIISETDALSFCDACSAPAELARVARAMDAAPLCLAETVTMREAVARLDTCAVQHALVQDDTGRIIGLLSLGDVLGGVEHAPLTRHAAE